MLNIFKYKKTIITLIVTLIIIIITYLYISSILNNKDRGIFLKPLISDEIKKVVKYYFFPSAYKKVHENQIQYLINKKKVNEEIIRKEVYLAKDFGLKKNLSDLKFKKITEAFNSKKNKLVINNEMYSLEVFSSYGDNIQTGINRPHPGSAYLEYYDDNIFILSSTGILGFGKVDENEIIFKQINNNINEFLTHKLLRKLPGVSVKDMMISDKKVFVSLVKENSDNCYATSLLSGSLDKENIIFEQLFETNECVHVENEDKNFSIRQSGGRIIKIDDKHIILSTGTFKNHKHAQLINSDLGKTIKIDISTGENEVFSMGHKSSQGLYFDKEYNHIISTEHAAAFGDEINFIKIKNEVVPNYGWPIASYGEHYSSTTKNNPSIYDKYPLYKSHKDYGFIEPIRYFSESEIKKNGTYGMGISQIVGVGEKRYFFGTMNDRSLYFFNLTDGLKVENLERIEIGERIRDLVFKDGRLFLFLEDTASIGIINYKFR